MHSCAHWRRTGPARIATTVLLALGALAAAVAAHAQGSSWPGRIEILPVRSQTLPSGSGGRVPAVVLIHGPGGIGSGPDLRAHVLNEAGIGAFILDSFSGRGIVSTVKDQDRLNSPSMTPNPYRAAGCRRDRTAPWSMQKRGSPTRSRL